jgi:hypothetical protein
MELMLILKFHSTKKNILPLKKSGSVLKPIVKLGYTLYPWEILFLNMPVRDIFGGLKLILTWKRL